jgi:uncharacterized protein
MTVASARATAFQLRNLFHESLELNQTLPAEHKVNMDNLESVNQKCFREEAEALFKRALYSAKGRGVDKKSKAVKFYREAAAQGHAEAQYLLAVCYAKGRGVDKDNSKAVKYYRKAAAHGHAKAQYKLR